MSTRSLAKYVIPLALGVLTTLDAPAADEEWTCSTTAGKTLVKKFGLAQNARGKVLCRHIRAGADDQAKVVVSMDAQAFATLCPVTLDPPHFNEDCPLEPSDS